MKKCKACKSNKQLSEFSIRKANADGLQSLCRSCLKNKRDKMPSRAESIARRKRNESMGSTVRDMIWATGLKTCTLCEDEKKIEEFSIRTLASDGLNCHCRDCIKKTREDDPGQKDSERRYVLNNQDKVKASKLAYEQKNPLRRRK